VMDSPELEARLQTAAREAERACDLLLNPVAQNLDECLAALGAAASHVERCQSALAQSPGSPTIFGQARRLQAVVARAESLLKSAEEFHRNWFQIFRARLGGYTARGDPAELACASRVYVQG
jgi:hypothetical protein